MKASPLYVALALAVAATPLIHMQEAAAQSARQVRSTVESTMVVTGTIGITADGSVDNLQFDQQAKLSPAIASYLDSTVRAWQFKPVEVDGRAVSAKAPLRIRLQGRLLPDGQMEVGIRSANFSSDDPASTESVTRNRLRPPSYPSDAVRLGAQGDVMMLIKVGRDGSAEDVIAEQVNMRFVADQRTMDRMRKVLADASVSAAQRWTFHPPTTGPHMDDAHWTVRVRVAFDFNTAGARERSAPGQWHAYIPGPKQSAPWRKDDGRAGSDLLPAGGVYMADSSRNDPELLTPLAEG